MVMWAARMRHGNLTLSDPLGFAELELVENYGPPDTLSLTGFLDELRPVLKPGRGCVVWDDTLTQRFSGVVQSLERRGDGTATAVFVSDTQRLWDRVVYPTPTASWSAQSTAYDTQTGTSEARILAYISRNAGSAALNTGNEQRRIPSLRLPASQGRGFTRTRQARFQNLGALVAEIAEPADLRVTIRQTYEGTTPYLDLVIDSVPDVSGWARFGDADLGMVGTLSEEYRYTLTSPTATHLLSAAGGQGSARTTTLRATSRESDWWRRVELFVDQRGSGTDAAEIAEGLDAAERESAAVPVVEASLASDTVVFGPAGVPVGAKVTVVLDDEQIVERVRTLTTTVTAEGVEVVPSVGADGTITATERALLRALWRIRELERV